MTLDTFDRATAEEGFRYELNKGVIEVSEVPGPEHLAQVEQLKEQLYRYKLSHRRVIHSIASSNEAKILLAASQSERHPDLALYFSPPPPANVWMDWIPKIVIEVVSKNSATRDYEEKPPEYRSFGVSEYWIVDAAKGQMTALTHWRGGRKKQIIKPPTKYSTQLLPGFSLDLKRVLAAAKVK